MAQFETADYKKKRNLYSIMGLLGDILFYPIILITLICCISIYTTKAENKVPTFFGISMASVSSGSMLPEFQIKDIVFLQSTSAGSLRAGDIIGFYFEGPNSSTKNSLTCIQKFERHKTAEDNTAGTATTFDSAKFNELNNQQRTDTHPTKDEISKNHDIYFHRIVGIYMKDDGTILYETEGDANSSPDGKLIYADYVVGKYIYTPKVLRGIFTFVATPTGMILLVVVPLSVLILFMLFSIIEQISKMLIERKVLARLIRYDSEESISANIGIEMEVPDKAKFYATAPQEERNGVADFLWGYMRNTHKEKDLGEYGKIMKVVENFEANSKMYWMYFISSVKSKRQKRQLDLAWQEWTADQKMQEKLAFMKSNKKIAKAPKLPDAVQESNKNKKGK